MPAYRSNAEAEIRDAVVELLREIRPEARIMHEVNCSLWGPNRIDVLAVSPAEIISVEVKSERDKLDRLPSQIASMLTMSHHVIVALHEKHLVEREEPTNKWAAHYERDGIYRIKEMPQEASGAIPWVYPERRRAMMDVHQGYDKLAIWNRPAQSIQRANLGSLDMLRVEEMRIFCEIMGVPAGKRATLTSTLPLIKWACTGEQITKGVCAVLRARECPEADVPVPISIFFQPPAAISANMHRSIPMASEPKTIKFQLMLSESEAKAIDDWGLDNRIRTRAEAIRRLCQVGLEANRSLPELVNSGRDLPRPQPAPSPEHLGTVLVEKLALMKLLNEHKRSD